MKNNNLTMSQNKSQSLLLKGFCCILFLFVILLPPTFEPSDWSRAILLRMIITAILFFLFFKYFYKKDFSFSVPKIKNPVYLPFFILLAFVACLILATLFSQDIMFSFFGSPGRAGGLLNYLFLFIFAVLLAVLTQEKDWKTMFKFLLGIGLAVSLLGFVQYFGILKNIFISSEGSRVNSFMGNSSFLAVYMLFLSFLSFTLFLQEKTRKIKIIYFCLFLIFIFTILITGSRATYLGVLAGFIYFFFFYPVKSASQNETAFREAGQSNRTSSVKNILSQFSSGVYFKFKLLKLVSASFLVFAVLIVFLFNFFPQISEKNKLLELVSDRLSIERIVKDLTGTRLVAWQMTLKAIKDKPLLGWGPENFYIGFEKYYDPIPFNRQRPWWDRAHNIFLDIAVTSGVFSAILYFSFWVVLLWQLEKFKKKQGGNEYAYLPHGIQAMFIGYLTVLFFNFDSFSTYLISFFFIGCSFYLILNQNQNEKKIISPIKNNILQKKPAVVFLVILIIIFFWFYNIKPIYIAGQIDHAKNLANLNKCDKSLLIMESIKEKSDILKSYAGLKYSDSLKRCVNIAPEKEVEYVKKGTEALKISSVFQPNFTRTWLFMGSFTNVLAAREQNKDNKNKLLSEARDYLNKAKSLSPGRQEIIIEIAKNYMVAEDYQSMKKASEDCSKIDPSQGECYWYMGIAEIFLGEQESGKKHIEESLSKGGFGPLYIQLGAAYISQKNYKNAAEVYRMLTLEHPENANYHAVYALLAREIGDYYIAGIEAVKVFELQPNNTETRDFLIGLLKLSPNDPGIHASLAFIYRKLGEEKNALKELFLVISYYSQLAEKNPDKYLYHFNLATAYKELGEYEKAYQEALLTEKSVQKLERKTDPNFYKKKLETLIQSLPGNYWEKFLNFLEENK